MDNYGSEKWVFYFNPMENQIPMTLPAWDVTHPADGKKFGTAWHARTHSSNDRICKSSQVMQF